MMNDSDTDKYCNKLFGIEAIVIRKSESSVWFMHCFAGGLSGAISKTTTAPLDRIKTFMQTTDNGGVRTTFKHLYQEGGCRSLWKGNGLNLLKTSPEFAIKFSMYDWMKKTLGSPDSDMSNGVRFIAGATAGASSQSFLYPVEITKTRLMVGHYKSVKEVINFTWKNEGLSGFFKGYVPHTTGMLIFTGIDLTVYEMAKQQFIGLNTPQWILNMASAICSSTFAHCTCYPISMLTTRLQVSSEPKIKFIHVVMKNIKKTGLPGLYRGFTPALIKMLPTMTISYVVYEELCSILGVNMFNQTYLKYTI